MLERQFLHILLEFTINYWWGLLDHIGSRTFLFGESAVANCSFQALRDELDGTVPGAVRTRHQYTRHRKTV
jgi:hypothetical protein